MNQFECACLESQDGEPVMLRGVTVSGAVRGLILEARVEQRFVNSTDKNVEVVYTFPLPWGAVLLGVEVQLGGKLLTGAVVEKKEAEGRYEEAISEGNAAIMLEKNHDQSYSLNLGNLAAQEECVITLRYAQILQFEQNGLRLLIPTVIAPRYGDAVMDGGLQPHQAPHYSLMAEYPFDIHLSLHGDLARARVASPSHPIGVVHETSDAGSVLTVALARQGALDRDFVLVIDQLEHDSVMVLARDCVELDGVVALASFFPRIPAQEPASIAVKILVDCSGSMAGDSIAASKRSLRAIVRLLGEGDRFSLSRFGNTVEHRSRGLWKVTETTQLAAQRWVDGLNADMGGTEMEAALASTFALPQTMSSDVLVVTDGEISAIDSAIESAKTSGHRLFVVGIGSSPAESHLRRLAEETGGACDFVVPGEAVEPAVLRMFARLRSPRLTDLRVEWPAGAAPEWVSPLPASVFDGDTVNVFALMRQVPVGEVRLLGARSPNGAPEVIGRARFGSGVEPADTLSRLAANIRFKSAETDWLVGAAPEAKQLAVAYQLVTDETNFLLVHQRDEESKSADIPELHKVDQMMAAGWGGMGSVLWSRTGGFLETRAVSYRAESSLDWGNADTPMVLRRSRSVDRGNSRYWSHSGDYVGLTPLGLSEWLRTTPVTGWPKTYSELRQIGLGIWVVDWLELIMATREDGVLPEQTVVGTFLYVMSRRETRQRLMTVAQQIKALFASKADAADTRVDMQLAEEMMAVLVDMTADTWPDRVYELGAIQLSEIAG